MTDAAASDSGEYAKLNPHVPHSARVWNYWVGGKDNFEIDRRVGDEVKRVYPTVVDIARASRDFLRRAVTFLAGEVGIRQFLDIGTGLPTGNNTHQIAQSIAPECRVVYVDNDPLVLVHARALLTSAPEGVTDYVDADVRDTGTVLAQATKILDFDRPIGLTMLGILGNIEDYDQARAIVRRLVDAIPSGSYLVVNDGTDTSEESIEGARVSSQRGRVYVVRSPEQIAAYFEGLELVEPGVVSTPLWRPEPDPSGPPRPLDGYCGVARKP